MKILYKIIVVGLAGIFCSTSCQSSPKAVSINQAVNPANTDNKTTVKNSNSSVNANTNSSDAPSDENFAKLFSGRIGDDNGDEQPKIPPFQMRLKRTGKELSGVYRYRNSIKDISLKGQIDEDNQFTLMESIGGRETGKFEGSLENNGDGLLKMSGVWSKPKSEDSIGFSADEIPMEMSGTVYIDDKSLVEKTKSIDMSISYPQITGATSPNVTKLNAALKNIGLQYQREFKKDAPAAGEEYSTEVSYTIHLATDNIFSIEFVDDSFSGGAHPNHRTKTFNFDLKNGKEIQLIELFKPGAKYLEKLAAISLVKIKADLGDGIFEEGIEPQAKNYQTWVIQKDGLLIYFDEYQAAPYVSGRQEVLAGYADLKELINPNGVIAAVVK